MTQEFDCLKDIHRLGLFQHHEEGRLKDKEFFLQIQAQQLREELKDKQLFLQIQSQKDLQISQDRLKYDKLRAQIQASNDGAKTQVQQLREELKDRELFLGIQSQNEQLLKKKEAFSLIQNQTEVNTEILTNNDIPSKNVVSDYNNSKIVYFAKDLAVAFPKEWNEWQHWISDMIDDRKRMLEQGKNHRLVSLITFYRLTCFAFHIGIDKVFILATRRTTR